MPKVQTSILTGFLGSGKTTLLNQVLNQAFGKKVAVLVNEFGDVGIDHHLLAYSTERIAVMSGGCICCSIREDIEESVRYLFEQKQHGMIEEFEYLVIETSGLANPIPLIQTLMSSPYLIEHLTLTSVFTTVDAMLGEQTLNQHTEAVKQVALANIIKLTKLDLCNGLEKQKQLIENIKLINPNATIIVEQELNIQNFKEIFQSKLSDYLKIQQEHIFTQRHFLQTGVQSFGFEFDQALDWTIFGIWLTSLLHLHGEKVLRTKGLLWVKQAESGPVGFNSVQHLVFPPAHYSDWKGIHKKSYLTFITKDLDIESIKRSFEIFMTMSQDAQMSLEGRKNVQNIGAGLTINGQPMRRPNTPRWLR